MSTQQSNAISESTGDLFASVAAQEVQQVPSIAAQVRQLAHLSSAHSAVELASTWIQLAFIIAITLYLDSWWATAAGIVLVGARQYALLILLHDGSHGLLHSDRKTNDRVSLWLVAAPCGSSYWNSRATHLRHHRFLGDAARDPDFFLYCSDSPAPKATPVQFSWHFLKLLLGGRVFHTFFGGGDDSAGSPESLARRLPGLIPVAAVQLALLGIFSALGHPFAYFYLWVLPLLTLAVFFDSARVFCDHSVPKGTSTAAESLLVSYVSNPVERFFLAPFHMNHHAEHHFFPYVPHYNLPALRQILRGSPEYGGRVQWRGGYVRYVLQFLFQRGRASSSPQNKAG